MANMSDIPKDEQWLIEFDETECFDDPGQKLAEAYDIICGLRSKLQAANDRAVKAMRENEDDVVARLMFCKDKQEASLLRRAQKAEAKVSDLVGALARIAACEEDGVKAREITRAALARAKGAKA
jgi:hypothetical protein